MGAIHRAHKKTAEVIRKIQSKLLIKQQQNKKISELNTAGDWERMKEVHALFLLFPWQMFMVTVRDYL